MKRSLHAGTNPLRTGAAPVQGDEVTLDGEGFYRITNCDRMRPFFMSIVSSSDLWMFLSSTGALTAGRRNADLAFFPYYTDDKIHDLAEVTGSKTILIVERAGTRSAFGSRFQSVTGEFTGFAAACTKIFPGTNCCSRNAMRISD